MHYENIKYHIPVRIKDNLVRNSLRQSYQPIDTARKLLVKDSISRQYRFNASNFYRVHVNLTTLNIFFFYLIKINSSWKLDQSKENLQMADTNENLCTFIIHFAEYLRLISIDFHSPFFPLFFKFTLTRPRIPRKIYIYRKRFAFLLFRLMNSALPFQNETVIFVLWWS